MPFDYSRLRFLLVLMLLVAIGGTLFTFFAGQAVLSANEDMGQQQAAIQSFTETFSLVKDAETGQRGYLLVGDKAYLMPYNRALSAIKQHLNDLDALANAGVIDAAALGNIEGLVKEKLDELRETIRVHDDVNPDAAIAIVSGGVGKATMDRLRDAIDRALRHHVEQLQRDRDRSALGHLYAPVFLSPPALPRFYSASGPIAASWPRLAAMPTRPWN